MTHQNELTDPQQSSTTQDAAQRVPDAAQVADECYICPTPAGSAWLATLRRQAAREVLRQLVLRTPRGETRLQLTARLDEALATLDGVAGR